MRLRCHIPLTCALLLVSVASAQKGPHGGLGRPGMSRPARPEKSRPAPKPDAGSPSKAAETPVERLDKMTPEERRKALQSLPPQRRQDLEKKLNDFKRLSPEDRQKLWERKKRFDTLPPEQQKQVRRVARQVSQLPENRRAQVVGEIETLRNMPDSERHARMNGEEFRSKYTPAEQQMLRGASSILPE